MCVRRGFSPNYSAVPPLPYPEPDRGGEPRMLISAANVGIIDNARFASSDFGTELIPAAATGVSGGTTVLT